MANVDMKEKINRIFKTWRLELVMNCRHMRPDKHDIVGFQKKTAAVYRGMLDDIFIEQDVDGRIEFVIAVNELGRKYIAIDYMKLLPDYMQSAVRIQL